MQASSHSIMPGESTATIGASSGGTGTAAGADDSEYYGYGSDVGEQQPAVVDYGYNTDDAASVVSMPPLSSSAFRNHDDPNQPPIPPRQRYQRRCSVTKFSLQTNFDDSYGNTTSATTTNGNATGNTIAAATASASARARRRRKGSDITSDSDSDSDDIDSNSDDDDDSSDKNTARGAASAQRRAHKIPQPGDDNYSENLENSGRFLRRSIRISDDDEDECDSDDEDDDRPARNKTDSKRPSLSTSAKNSHKSTASPLRRPKNELEDDSTHGRKQNPLSNNTTTGGYDAGGYGGIPRRPSHPEPTKQLENDSGHIKKFWYNESTGTPAKTMAETRRDSMTSVGSDDNSEAEFGSDSVVSPEPRQQHSAFPSRPPKNPMSKMKTPSRSSPPSLSAFLSSNDRAMSQSAAASNNTKTTIDGDMESTCSSYLDDNQNGGGMGSSSRRSKMRARRTSIVGVPSGSGDSVGSSSIIDDISSSHDAGSDDEQLAAVGEPYGSRRRKLRARRTSIVGVPASGDDNSVSSSVNEDLSSRVGSDDDKDEWGSKSRDETTSPSKRTQMRARRSSIVGIPGAAEPTTRTSPNKKATEKKETQSIRRSPSSSHSDSKAESISAGNKAGKRVVAAKMKVAKTARSSPTQTKGNLRGCLKLSVPRRGVAELVPKKVRFGHLLIKEFPIILGDNPAVTAGAPVTIDWVPQNEISFSVNAYEQCKPRRRRRRKLLISVSNRAILLLAAGYTIDEIADASMDAQSIKEGRQQTLENQSWDRMNLLMENTGGALGGIFLQPLQSTGKKLKALMVKPQQHSESARMA